MYLDSAIMDADIDLNGRHTKMNNSLYVVPRSRQGLLGFVFCLCKVVIV